MGVVAADLPQMVEVPLVAEQQHLVAALLLLRRDAAQDGAGARQGGAVSDGVHNLGRCTAVVSTISTLISKISTIHTVLSTIYTVISTISAVISTISVVISTISTVISTIFRVISTAISTRRIS